MTMENRTRKLGVFAALAIAVAGLVSTPSVAVAKTDHCIDHKTEVKVEAEDSPATVSVIDSLTGTEVDVVVTIVGSDLTIEAVDPTLDLVDASWCVKSSTNTNSGTGLTGASTSMNKKGVVQDISYVVVYSVTSADPVPPPQPCDATTTSGGAGVTVTDHELGQAGATSFLFEWEAFSIPDRFEVLYEGNLIYDTGNVGDDINEGTGSDTVNVPVGTQTFVTVRVTGPDFTAWNYRVNCPVPAP